MTHSLHFDSDINIEWLTMSVINCEQRIKIHFLTVIYFYEMFARSLSFSMSLYMRPLLYQILFCLIRSNRSGMYNHNAYRSESQWITTLGVCLCVCAGFFLFVLFVLSVFTICPRPPVRSVCFNNICKNRTEMLCASRVVIDKRHIVYVSQHSHIESFEISKITSQCHCLSLSMFHCRRYLGDIFYLSDFCTRVKRSVWMIRLSIEINWYTLEYRVHTRCFAEYSEHSIWNFDFQQKSSVPLSYRVLFVTVLIARHWTAF